LRENYPGLNGLAETDFIRKDCTTRLRGSESEEGGVNLMRIQINLSIRKGGG
jgi:hypothetical protein